MSTLLRDLRSLGPTTAPSSIAPTVLARLGLGQGHDDTDRGIAHRGTASGSRAATRDRAQRAGFVRGEGSRRRPVSASAPVTATDRYVEIDSPIGRVFAAFNERGATAVMRAPSPRAFERAYRRATGRDATASVSRPAWLARRPLRTDLAQLTPFEQAVLTKAAEIPPGQVRTYSWVAREIKRPAAVRAVGSALGRNPIPLLIPCHRVVRTDGRIGDFIYGTAAKRRLLRSEGVDPELLERHAKAGIRYLGSDTTRIFCVPTCHAARRITPRHRVPFGSPRDAQRAGYRACKLCRPAA